MSAAPDGSVLATEQVDDSGLFYDSHTRFYELPTGAERPQALSGWWWTVAGDDGLIVASKGPDVSVLRPETLTPVREMASMPGEIKALDAQRRRPHPRGDLDEPARRPVRPDDRDPPRRPHRPARAVRHPRVCEP